MVFEKKIMCSSVTALTYQRIIIGYVIQKPYFIANKVTGLALRPETFPSLFGGHIAACLFTTHGAAQIGHLSVAYYGKKLKPSKIHFTLFKCACLSEAFSAALFIDNCLHSYLRLQIPFIYS